MKTTIVAATLAIGALCMTTNASAQTSTRQVSITVSPIHLLTPVLEVTGELQVAPNIGVALILGAGQISAGTSSALVYEAGGQGRYYAVGDFDSGLHFGVEALYVGLSLDANAVAATGSGLSLGGFGGYKHTFGPGFVLEGQLGYAYTVIQASASNGIDSTSTSSGGGGLLLNLNLGWAF